MKSTMAGGAAAGFSSAALEIMRQLAHHLLPASRENIAHMLPEALPSVIFITVHPEAVSVEALRMVEVVIALGTEAADVIAEFCGLIGAAAPPDGVSPAEDDEVLVWRRTAPQQVRGVKADRPVQARRRHTRKYAEGELGRIAASIFGGRKTHSNCAPRI